MTKELFNAVSRAFKTDCPPIHAVAIDDNERVYVLAVMFEGYSPKGSATTAFGAQGFLN